MKTSKYIYIALSGMLLSASINNAYALVSIDPIKDSCAQLGLTIGTSCTCSMPNVACETSCESSRNCVLQSLLNACTCAQKIEVVCTPEMASSPCANSYGNTNTLTGVQTGHTQIRDATTCACSSTSQTVYRCGAGWYDISSTTASTSVPTCKECPTVGNNAVAGQSSAGAKLITSCYAPANTNITDDTGTYRFTEPCKYSN